MPRFSLVLVSLGTCFACAGSPSEVRSPNSASASGVEIRTPAAPAESDASVVVAPEIAQACGIDQSDAYFTYNSAALRERESGILAKLSHCFAEGPLAGRSMKLVGHADPRGDEEYNFALAGRRAERVRQALTEHRLDPARVSATSRGELDASGSDESGWSRDRRVEVLLAN